MDGFEWSPSVPFVPMELGEDGWCVRDAVCELFRWEPGSPEWCRFIEGPQGRDVPRLAEHIGLTTFEIPQNWNDLIGRTAHPGIAVFDFHVYHKSHAIYVYNVEALIHHWPTAEGPPATASERWLFWYGWPLRRLHLERGPVLGAVLLDERNPPHSL
jgi:hypothetical protein